MQRKSWKAKIAGMAATAALAAGMLPLSALGAGALTLDGSISVSGLDAGDTAVYYQIIEQDVDTQDPPHQGTQAWKLTAAVDSDGDGKIDGSNYTVDDLVITGDPDSEETDKEVITAGIANAIAAAIAGNEDVEPRAMGTADADGKIEARDVDAGLYMVVAVPGDENINTIYKPIFVSADYNAKDNTNTLEVVTDKTDYKDKTGVFKRSELEIDKKSGQYDEEGNAIDTQHDVAVGDVVDFTITTNLPIYTKNYTDAFFKVTDNLTEGLKLVDADGDETAAAELIAENITVTVENYKAVRGTDYTVTVTPTGKFEVEFLNDKDPATDADGDGTADNDRDGILYTILGNPTITIKYQAKVTSEAAEQVNQMDNTVTLEFSNNPEDETSYGELKDRTRHYTFGIDANVFGQGGGTDKEKTTEIRKVSVDAEGNEVVEVIESEVIETEKPSWLEWLDGAEFELKQTHEYVNDDPATTGKHVALDSPEVIKFKDGLKSDDEDATGPVSDANGYITMKGLDAGVYQLKETKAPAGYTFDPSKIYTITITPKYLMDGFDPENEILASYTVTIDFTDDEGTEQHAVTEYAAGTDADDNTISFIDEGEYEEGEEPTVTVSRKDDAATTLILNKKLGILPATGGSGIFFYLGVGGAIALVALYFLSKNKREIEELTA